MTNGCAWVALAALTGLLSSAQACSSTDASPAAAGGAAGGATADAASEDATPEAQDEPAPSIPLKVTVVLSPTRRADPPTPLQGATVALDSPGAARVEVKSDANGVANFDGIDWSKGALTVTGWKDGTDILSVTGISSSPQDLTLTLNELKQDRVKLSGKALNMMDSAKHYLLVTEEVAGAYWQQIGPSYNVSVLPGAPFTLVATEFSQVVGACGRCYSQQFYGWVAVGNNGVTTPATLDIDFANKISEVHQVHGTIELPTNPDSVLITSSSYAYLMVNRGAANIGFVTKTFLNGDETAFTYDAEYVALDGPEPAYTDYMFYAYPTASTNVLSVVRRPGYPEDGIVVSDFLDPPTMTKPSDPSIAAPLLSRIEWTSAAVNADAQVQVVLASTSGRWTVVLRPGSTSMELPAPPSGVDVATFFGSNIQGMVVLLSAKDPNVLNDMRIAQGIPFRLSL